MTLPAPPEQLIALHVRDIMNRQVPHARTEDTVSQVARCMSESKAGHVVVVDGRSRVVGVTSEGEIRRFYLSYIDPTEFELSAALVAANHTLIETLLAEEPPVTIRPDALLAQAIGLMEKHQLDFLPVVDRYEELKGLLTTADILHEFTLKETTGLETGFEFFEPLAGRARKRPAFVRRANKELVIPLARVAQEHELAEKVMLGFDEASGRILLKFIPAGLMSENTLAARRQGEHLVITAQAFVQHYHLLDRPTTFDVQTPDDTRYLVLVPR